jgi:hypothetical protein
LSSDKAALYNIARKFIERRQRPSQVANLEFELFCRKQRLKGGDTRVAARCIYEAYLRYSQLETKLTYQKFFRLFHKRFKRIKSNGNMFYLMNRKTMLQ